jgi:hypothetical protein
MKGQALPALPLLQQVFRPICPRLLRCAKRKSDQADQVLVTVLQVAEWISCPLEDLQLLIQGNVSAGFQSPPVLSDRVFFQLQLFEYSSPADDFRKSFIEGIDIHPYLIVASVLISSNRACWPSC